MWAGVEPLRAEDLHGDRPVVTVRKLRVTPGDRLANFQGIYVLRELIDPGELKEDTILPLDIADDICWYPAGMPMVTKAMSKIHSVP